MPITVTCPCGKRLRVKDELAGKRVKCPGCGTVLPTPPSLAPAVVAPSEVHSTAGSAEPEQPDAHAAAEVPTDVAVAPLKKDSYTGKRWHKPALFAGAGVAALLCGLGVWYFALKGTADGPLDLPGASGPPLVDLGKPPGFMPLKRIFLFFPEATKDVEAQPQLVNKMFSGKLGDTYPRQGQGWSQSFPSGTKALIVGVAFDPPPPNGTKLDVRVLSKAGPVPLRRGGFITLYGEGEIIGLLDCFPASGAFLDGPYQIEVIINDVKCALLNLRVGN